MPKPEELVVETPKKQTEKVENPHLKTKERKLIVLDSEDAMEGVPYVEEDWPGQPWEKMKRQLGQRATRSSNKKKEVPKPSPDVNMEDAPKDKKQGNPSYKLKYEIELAKDLKKVFEERILNSKVEMTLGDILVIAKREFHEEIINIIKRK
ncbi:hypothetical protein L7F22_017115 [Adiantum nelumboides]|nr:hypothetical protein [Adiantum nelumboides]